MGTVLSRGDEGIGERSRQVTSKILGSALPKSDDSPKVEGLSKLKSFYNSRYELEENAPCNNKQRCDAAKALAVCTRVSLGLLPGTVNI